ncbi:hypothetical protein COU77_02510 [Candidatus Peregrinibacteria bacterium CG10_big_fil_rev_8_21_14_0_10_49_16]|nr:MAG: hypothetical protein COW95_01020 [Candidatus Peregrinibacteria bacterium CG22_combo_CG10-13_8_21_14_all_49_11]PIR52045.1 MAG: hypothetical protein COU77_02510 [Candidatus Peregrinibacteria bacterium CG10_big_fil_rev_8_21_14_0_10_49_16]
MRLTPLLTFFGGVTVALTVPALAQNGVPFFGDVERDSYYDEAVSDLSRIGIVRGYDDGRFGPHDPVTRAQVAVMIKRYDQTVVQQLRDQIAEIQRELHLGECGNGTRETGEQCDDGNKENGDGCDKHCREEWLPKDRTCDEGQYHLGENFPAPDGCNNCTCTTYGVVCTKKACEEVLCEGKYKVGETYRAADGCNTCKCMANGASACTFMACPQEPKPSACGDLKRKYGIILSESRACKTDEDCTVFSASCPFLTCGEGINKIHHETVAEVARSLTSCMQESGEPVPCAGCIPARAACREGRCVISKDTL